VSSVDDRGKDGRLRHSFLRPMQTDPRSRLRTVIALLLFAASGLAADTRVTLSRTQLHATPRAGSRVVAVVPAGVRLSVECSKSWCSTSWNGADLAPEFLYRQVRVPA